ncbi:MAG: hypothetical protein RR382_09855, partial [Tannerellaceae bacterium]
AAKKNSSAAIFFRCRAIYSSLTRQEMRHEHKAKRMTADYPSFGEEIMCGHSLTGDCVTQV